MLTKKVTAMPDLEFSAVGFGCWGISGGDVWNNTTDDASLRTVQTAVDRGINFFDVAPIYGMGHAETILGQALKGQRDKVLIGTKCGLIWDDQKNVTINLTAQSIQQEIDQSLRRLQTDYVDLYQIHWPDPNTPIEETMVALQQVKESGKVRYIGVTNFSLALTQQAMAVTPIASHQGLYNMLERNPERYHNIPLTYRVADEVLPYCQENGMAFLPYSPLFQGLLTGAFKATDNFGDDDVRSENPKLVGDAFKQYFEIVEKLNSFAQEIGKPLGQIALNWLVNQETVTSIIAGAQTPAHVEENVACMNWELTAEMQARLDEIIAPYQATGVVQ